MCIYLHFQAECGGFINIYATEVPFCLDFEHVRVQPCWFTVLPITQPCWFAVLPITQPCWFAVYQLHSHVGLLFTNYTAMLVCCLPITQPCWFAVLPVIAMLVCCLLITQPCWFAVYQSHSHVGLLFINHTAMLVCCLSITQPCWFAVLAITQPCWFAVLPVTQPYWFAVYQSKQQSLAREVKYTDLCHTYLTSSVGKHGGACGRDVATFTCQFKNILAVNRLEKLLSEALKNPIPSNRLRNPTNLVAPLRPTKNRSVYHVC